MDGERGPDGREEQDHSGGDGDRVQVEQQEPTGAGEDAGGRAGRADAEHPAAGRGGEAGDAEAGGGGGPQDTEGGPAPEQVLPGPVRTNASGARKAGRAYLRACHMVGSVRPPVMADAPTAASAVGGVTSESTE
ncbi:hypothetical protein Prum_061930 [Phytohabitans rumicis]|uniref:Uncharacterized protein n=1 Tax=Phytohabitans rumicis TaxID=1076125 RepID=A0A6V8LCP1_9ACTN|nr:hypothetical protein Prum_061930 [Phytohabitans rumicis]